MFDGYQWIVALHDSSIHVSEITGKINFYFFIIPLYIMLVTPWLT